MGCKSSKAVEVVINDQPPRKVSPVSDLKEDGDNTLRRAADKTVARRGEHMKLTREVSLDSEVGQTYSMDSALSTPARLGSVGGANRIVERMGTKSGLDMIRRMSNYNVGDHYDVIVLGGGPAGVRAAVEAAGRGHRVGLIEPKATVHGAPTGAHSKVLREAVLHGARTWEEVEDIKQRALKAARRAAARQLKTYMIEVLQGTAKVRDESSVEFSPTNQDKPAQNLLFDMLVIATGSKSNRFPPVSFDLPGVFDSDTIWSIDRIPKKLVVQGAGIIGLEYALIFKKLGTESVTIIDLHDKVVPMLDVCLQEACKKTMAAEGIELIMKAKFQTVEAMVGSTAEDPQIMVSLEDGRTYACDCLLSACGRAGTTQNLGLEALSAQGLKVGRGGFIQIDENGFTGVGKIYAVGDCAGGNLATIGQAQAVRAIRAALGSGMISKEVDIICKPSGVWTVPELAWAGITEEKAKEDGLNFGTVRVGFDLTVRGCVSQEDGFLKLVYDAASGKILGVHMYGENSCDLINFGAEAVCNGDTVYDVLQFVFPAVTYHELYHLAAWEAKQRIMHSGAKSLRAATAWQRVELALRKSCQEQGKTCKDVLYNTFKYFDLDSSGYITPEQLKDALGGLGMRLNEKQVMEMVVEATGSPQDTNIEYEDFLRIFHEEVGSPRHSTPSLPRPCVSDGL